MKTMSSKEVVGGVAKVTSTSDVLMRIHYEFKQMCLEAATHLQKRIGAITVHFCYTNVVPESLQKARLQKEASKITRSLCARIAWRGSVFAEIHSYTESKSNHWSIVIGKYFCTTAFKYPIKKSAKPYNCATTKKLIAFLNDTHNEYLDKKYEQLTKRLLKIGEKEKENYRPLCQRRIARDTNRSTQPRC